MALPPPPIQIRPPGLLPLLGIQNGGKNPDLMSGFLQPTFELADWYLRAKQETISGTTTAIVAATTVGFVSDGTTFVCPNGEWWWVQNYTCLLQGGALDSIESAALAFSTTTILVVGEPMQLPGVVAGAIFLKTLTASDFWIPPGSQLGLYLGNCAGATGNYTQRAVVTKVSV